MRPRAKSCLVCGRRVEDGTARCAAHKVGSGRPRPCLVCGRSSQGNYCPAHEPQVDEQVRNAANPYRRAYKSAEYATNRQHRFERARGRCEMCGVHLETGAWECDHVVALRDGGTNHIDNLRVLCRPCHRGKTRRERQSRN